MGPTKLPSGASKARAKTARALSIKRMLTVLERDYEAGRSPMHIDGDAMILQIAKWGNSLALRILADYARQTGLREGSWVQATLTVDGGISIRASKWNRGAFAQALEKMREGMPTTHPGTEELRRGARY